MTNFEASGNIANWPKNVPGKPTQVAVFGMYHPKKGKVCEILFTAKFPELEPAMYWAAKKELEAVRKGTWMMASRVLWQHELTPEQAVEAVRKQMEAQVDRVIDAAESGAAPDLGDGPMQPVDPSKVDGYYVEVSGPDGNDVMPPFIVPPDQIGDVAKFFEPLHDDDDGDMPDGPAEWVPRDPRR